MKITKQHYNKIKTEINKVITDDVRAVYKKQGLSKARLAWDAFYGSVPSSFICKVLYKYLDDSHIKTAILKIVGEY